MGQIGFEISCFSACSCSERSSFSVSWSFSAIDTRCTSSDDKHNHITKTIIAGTRAIYY